MILFDIDLAYGLYSEGAGFPSWNHYSRISLRHNNKPGVLYVDGHAASHGSQTALQSDIMNGIVLVKP